MINASAKSVKKNNFKLKSHAHAHTPARYTGYTHNIHCGVFKSGILVPVPLTFGNSNARKPFK